MDPKARSGLSSAVGPRRVELVAKASEGGERIDKVLAARLASEGVSRSMLARWCAEGRVSVGAEVLRASARLKEGDTVVVEVPAVEPCEAVAEDLPLTVVFEDAELMVVDKPAGMVVHPAAGHPRGTLVNAVLHHAEVDDGDTLRPGIVHRIDKDTSGLLVVAKTRRAREGLMEQFRAHSLERVYFALTEGVPGLSLSFDTLHGRHPTERLRFTAKVRQGKRAVTHVERLEDFAGVAALVRCTLETGRTHQIRMHLSEAGFALLGDGLYGRRPELPALGRIAEALGRQALHAAVLGFVHPVTGEGLCFRSELPPDLAQALASLRALGAQSPSRVLGRRARTR